MTTNRDTQSDRETQASGSGRSDEQFVQAPVVNLPKGGGAISGIGEKFATNPVTGTSSISIPIAASAGRAGFAPQLTLSYDSGAGNGAFGLGWNLSSPSVTRKTNRGLPRYRDAHQSDVFLLSDAEDLVPVTDTAGNRIEEVRDGFRIDFFRPRTEGLFARIERWSDLSDLENVAWRSISKENQTSWYGKTADS